MKVKIACISDTHSLHDKWHDKLKYDEFGYETYSKWKDADIILHAGDCTSSGYMHEVKAFLDWFNTLPAPSKIFIAGNHDFFFDTGYKYQRRIPCTDVEEVNELLKPYQNLTYLNENTTNSFGLNIYGTPIQPWFNNWAFNKMRGDEIQLHWDKIPSNTDILIVHGPPHGILDLLHPKFRMYNENPNVGCKLLLKKIQEVKPKAVIFGHIHEEYGVIKKDGITFVNASCLNENYKPVNAPQFIEIEI